MTRSSVLAIAGCAAIATGLGAATLVRAEPRPVTVEGPRLTAPTDDFLEVEAGEWLSAGSATSHAPVDQDAFSHPVAGLSVAETADFAQGRALFNRVWVPAPSTDLAADGLGPLFNAPSCQSCHHRNGRGRPPDEGGGDSPSMFLRLSVPPSDEAEREALADGVLLSIPEPTYGGQLQHRAVPGVPAEGRMTITYEDLPVAFADGAVASLRRPTYGVAALAYGALADGVLLSPRVAPPMIGLGRIERIDPDDIQRLADPHDADGDGISGRASLLRGPAGGAPVLGRFGWKATVPTIRGQSAGAFVADMGISVPTSPFHWGDCTSAETACRAAPIGVQTHLGDTEAPDPVLDLVTFYAGNLAVPARRDADDRQVLRGKALFYRIGCVACHVPKFVTRPDARNLAEESRLIWPYSDFLLHDMGEGLADNRPVGAASGREWRTPPLWGLGLTATVSGHTNLLHDGRARNLLEAILWHGGEATAARHQVVNMAAGERAALLRFLKSL